MFDSPLVDVALGLALLYVVLSIAASSITELISSALSLRSRNLRKGVDTLLGKAHSAKVFEHPLVKNMARDGKHPSYIESGTLATVLVDLLARDEDGKLVVSGEDSATKLLARLEPDPSLQPVLHALASRGGKTVDDLRTELAGWFDEGMARISGWYKRRAHWIIVATALAVTVAANASTFHAANELWANKSLRASVAQAALETAAAEELPTDGESGPSLADFPLGWEGEDFRSWSFLDWLSHVFGWAVTVFAVSLGAPFWFDVLGKVANLRMAGPRRTRAA